MIFIDAPQQWPGALARRLGPSAHLVTDGSPSELAAFALRIGMKPQWLQLAGTYREHYDVFGSRIEKAIAAGAVCIDRRRFVEILRAKRVAIPVVVNRRGDREC